MIRYPLEPDVPQEPEDIEALFRGTRMTLCMAAACIERKQPRIVTCIDWKATTALGSTQTFDKFQELGKGKGWIALMAGKASRARELTKCVSLMLKCAEVTADNFLSLVKGGVAIHSRNLKEEYTMFRFGMDYERFQKWCGEVNPILAKPYVDELAKLKFGASLLVAGFVKDEEGDPYPVICKVSQQSGEVTLETHFGAIGEGASIAIPPLLRREYDWEDVQLGKAIYYLYEAKTLAEILDSVGPLTSVDVLYPDGELKSLESSGYKYYGKLLEEFGPKPKVTHIEWKDEYLGPFEDKANAKQPPPSSTSRKLKPGK